MASASSGIVGIVRRLGVIDEIAVEIDIVFIDAPVPGKAVGIERMHQHDARARRRRQALAQQAGLARRNRNSLPPHGCPRSAAMRVLASRGPMAALSMNSGLPSGPLALGCTRAMTSSPASSQAAMKLRARLAIVGGKIVFRDRRHCR